MLGQARGREPRDMVARGWRGHGGPVRGQDLTGRDEALGPNMVIVAVLLVTIHCYHAFPDEADEAGAVYSWPTNARLTLTSRGGARAARARACGHEQKNHSGQAGYSERRKEGGEREERKQGRRAGGERWTEEALVGAGELSQGGKRLTGENTLFVSGGRLRTPNSAPVTPHGTFPATTTGTTFTRPAARPGPPPTSQHVPRLQP